MKKRIAVIGAAILVGGALGTWVRTTGPEAVVMAEPADALPLPPVPPRIAYGAEYEHCLERIDADPAGADNFADGWEAAGGGDGAQHCRALALIALGDLDSGARMLDKLGRTSHAPALARASIFGQAVQAWLMADQPGRAYAAATDAVTLSPNDADLRIDRSVAAAAVGRYRDAIGDLDQAIALDPHRFDALVLRAAAWRQEKRLDRARDDIDRALEINPDYPEALLERGILRQRLGDRVGAGADWKHAIELNPDSRTADLAEQNLALLDAGPEQP